MDLKNNGKIDNYIRIIFLPLLLVVLFVIQSQAFNWWLSIYSKAYFIRLSLVAFALGVVIYGPALLIKKRYRYWYLFIISFLVSLLFIAQFLYYKYSQSFLQFSAIKYFTQADNVVGTIKTLLSPELLLFILNILVFLAAYIIYVKNSSVEIFLSKWEKVSVILVMIVIVFFGYKYLLYTEKNEWGDTSRLYTDVYDLKALVGKMGITNFFLEDTYKYILRVNLVKANYVTSLEMFANDRNALISKKYFGIDKEKNLIIIQVESLENAVINQKINNQEITPNLNILLKDGLYFNNYYSQVGPGNTADAEFSTMNSLYPLPDDVAFINYAKNTYMALPQFLVESGYQAYSMHGDSPTFWNRSNIYPELGYQKSYGIEDYNIVKPVGEGSLALGDEDFFSQSLPKLKIIKEPFMATLITISSHTPFLLPIDLQKLQISSNENLSKIQKDYLQSINYTDEAIGKFINGLEENGLYDNSLIVILGDHGSFTGISSALGEENIIPELSNSHVPMIILNSGIDSQIITKPSSQIDNYPTITNLLGLIPPKSILGQDILNAKSPIETHFKPVSGGVDAILSAELIYQASSDGLFQNGSCKSAVGQESLPISDCQNIYTEQASNLKASNIIVRGNLLSVISK